MKFHKAFTLIEILIIIAFLGTVYGLMTVSFFNGNLTGMAKATAIIKNIATCRMAAYIYFQGSCAEVNDSLSINGFLNDDSEYIPAWRDLTIKDNCVVFSASGEIPSEWSVTVDFSNDVESSNVLRALKKFSPCSELNSYKVKFYLLSGKIENI